MTTYLIDYENVREDGLNGLYQLPSSDRVVIFYTAENEKISLKWFSMTKAGMSAIKVAPGAQKLLYKGRFHLPATKRLKPLNFKQLWLEGKPSRS